MLSLWLDMSEWGMYEYGRYQLPLKGACLIWKQQLSTQPVQVRSLVAVASVTLDSVLVCQAMNSLGLAI